MSKKVTSKTAKDWGLPLSNPEKYPETDELEAGGYTVPLGTVRKVKMTPKVVDLLKSMMYQGK